MDKSKLLADRVSSEVGELEIPGVGTVKFRALSRYEMLKASQFSGDDQMAGERYILAAAMLDPVMGEDDIAAWQKSSVPGEINAVANAVNALSGIGPGAEKERYKSVRSGSESGV